MTEHEARLSAALAAYPQGYSTTADLAAHWLIKVRADDVRQLLGDVHAYRETMRVISSEAPTPMIDRAEGERSAS